MADISIYLYMYIYIHIYRHPYKLQEVVLDQLYYSRRIFQISGAILLLIFA